MNNLLAILLIALSGCSLIWPLSDGERAIVEEIKKREAIFAPVAPTAVMPDLLFIEFIEISTAEELVNIRNGADKAYRMVSDINISEHNWELVTKDAVGLFTDTAFAGVFDGNGYKITGFQVNRREAPISLFGNVSGGVIMNLTLEDVDVHAVDYLPGRSVAGFVNNLLNSIIINCHISGKITGIEGAGGIVASAKGSIISDSSSSVTITVNDSWFGNSLHSGGIASSIMDSEITNSHSTGDVIGISTDKHKGYVEVGGIVGIVTNSVLRNVYSTGNVHSDGKGWGNYVGGIVGVLKNSEIENAYSTGNVTGKRAVGGIAGIASRSKITNAYSEGDISALLNGAGAITGNIYDSILTNVSHNGSILEPLNKEFAGDETFGLEVDLYEPYSPSW